MTAGSFLPKLSCTLRSSHRKRQKTHQHRGFSLTLSQLLYRVTNHAASFRRRTRSFSLLLLAYFVDSDSTQTKPATMADMMFYLKKNKEKEAIKQKEREEKAKLKDVLITDTAETSIR